MTKILLVAILALAVVGTFADDIFLGEDHEPGIIQIDGAGNDLFYWLFRSRKDKDQDPLVFWLTGGPGCSSIVALFGENGPFKINNDTSLRINPWSWNNDSNIVFVDQPRGTGFSKAKSYVGSEDEIAADFFAFLNMFYQKHPEYKGRSMFITGESYAGHYVPAIAAYILKQGKKEINLVGIAIGNGLVDPYTQYPAYAEFSLENKLISTPTYYLTKGLLGLCQMLIKTGIWPIALYECQLSLMPIIGLPIWPAFNVYDIREKCAVPPLCYDFSIVDKFLARKDVRAALGVGDRPWVDCNMDVHSALLADWMLTLAPKVTDILASNVFTLVYSGDKDFICNWRGGEAWTNIVPFGRHDEYSKLNYTEWVVDGKKLGQYKMADPLAFLRVYDAGHMVPMDQPEASLNMLTKFFKRWAYMKKHGHPPADIQL